MSMQEFDGDGMKGDAKKVCKDFDCPTCNANNPYDDGISEGDEVRCFYCGAEFRVRMVDGKFRYKEI